MQEEDGSPNLSRQGGSAFLAAESTPSKFTNGSGDGVQTAPSSAFVDRSATSVETNGQSSSAVPPAATEKLQAAGLPTNTTELKNAATNAANTVSSAATNAAASVGLTSQSEKAPSTTSSSVPDSLQKDLAAARAEIEKLKAALKEKESEGLRQRNIGGSSADNKSTPIGSQVATITQEGIPAQMVAVLCFGVFLFTW